MAGPVILGPDGEPMERKASAFTAGDTRSQELALYTPFNYSADAAILPNRETIAGRVHDIARNDGWASAALRKHLDNVIGARFTLSSRPDWRALGLSPEWAAEWSRDLEAKWRSYAEDPDYHCDAARRQSMVGLFGQMYGHRIMDGEFLALLLWLPDRGGNSATTVQVVDPDRLSQPHDQPEQEFMRGGVELGPHGEPLAYHIRKGHPGDIVGFGVSGRRFEWERVPRETPFGRRIVLHDFDATRAGQTRGVSPLAPIVEKLLMLGNYDRAELQAAVANALLAAWIESPFDHEMVGQALGVSQSDLTEYQSKRMDFHGQTSFRLNGMRIPIMFPGEKVNAMNATRPAVNFAPFQQAGLRNIATALGVSYEQLSMDWSQVNYSSARAALLEVWKGFMSRRTTFADQGPRQIKAAWLEEKIDSGEIELPPGAPDFQEAKAAYTRCRWIGPGRGWVDPVKEAQGAQLRLKNGLSTLQDEAAEQGLDWEETAEQLDREIAFYEERGLAHPAKADMNQVAPATVAGDSNAET